MNKPFISVIICTRNRPHELLRSMASVLNNTYQQFELIVIDQSTNAFNKIKLPHRVGRTIHYYRQKSRGLSKGRNYAISKARGDIIAFTDDDCLAHRDWLKNIAMSFNKNNKIVGLFGRVEPYLPFKKKNTLCSAYFNITKTCIINNFNQHWKNIGIGCNMAFKKEIFHSYGFFKSWLGTGSNMESAEDTEFACRLLSKGKPLLCASNIAIYHTRWIQPNDYWRQLIKYHQGEIACYSYFLFSGKLFAGKICLIIILKTSQEFFRQVKKALFFHTMNMSEFLRYAIENSRLIFGFIGGAYYGIKSR